MAAPGKEAIDAANRLHIGYVGPSNPLGYRRLCKDHAAVDYRHVWGCPDCLVELRARNVALVEAAQMVIDADDMLRGEFDAKYGAGASHYRIGRTKPWIARLRAALAADAKGGEDADAGN